VNSSLIAFVISALKLSSLGAGRVKPVWTGWAGLNQALPFHLLGTALATGIFLWRLCSLAPGPLLVLVLAQMLRHGPRESREIALTPLITNALIVLVALVVAVTLAKAIAQSSIS
jgi:hypothetical protein